jgi:DNA replication protein DnaC
MPSSHPTHPPTPTPIPTTGASEAVTTLSLAEVLRALGLHHVAALLDTATAKAITRNDSPTALLDQLMREELRLQLEHRAQTALKRSAIFPLTTLDTFDFDYPKTIGRDLVLRAATLDFIRDKANCVFVGPTGLPS